MRDRVRVGARIRRVHQPSWPSANGEIDNVPSRGEGGRLYHRSAVDTKELDVTAANVLPIFGHRPDATACGPVDEHTHDEQIDHNE